MSRNGVNDAPALAPAQVSIVTGDDVDIESAGVTSLGYGLTGIVRARQLLRAVMQQHLQEPVLRSLLRRRGGAGRSWSTVSAPRDHVGWLTALAPASKIVLGWQVPPRDGRRAQSAAIGSPAARRHSASCAARHSARASRADSVCGQDAVSGALRLLCLEPMHHVLQ
jgi:hypothetical protein